MNKLEFRDIMAGDLVQLKNNSGNSGKIIRVSRINQIDGCVTWLDEDDQEHTETIDNIEYIPLTDKIFEDSEFKYCDKQFFEAYDNNGLHIVPYIGGNYITNCGSAQITLKFVHQLQHLYNMCHLEDRIKVYEQ